MVCINVVCNVMFLWSCSLLILYLIVSTWCFITWQFRSVELPDTVSLISHMFDNLKDTFVFEQPSVQHYFLIRNMKIGYGEFCVMGLKPK